MKLTATIFFLLITVTNSFAQPERWQQHIKYNIDVKMDAINNKFNGIEKTGIQQ